MRNLGNIWLRRRCSRTSGELLQDSESRTGLFPLRERDSLLELRVRLSPLGHRRRFKRYAADPSRLDAAYLDDLQRRDLQL